MESKMGQQDKKNLNTLRAKSQEEHAVLIADPEQTQSQATFGERFAEKITGAIATWTFIMVQTGIILGWTAYNIIIKKSAFDPYPFILLNLFLSFQSAYTAPAIMMNQKRQAKNDMVRREMESDVNVKADLELTYLHEKVDKLTSVEIESIKAQLGQILILLEKTGAQAKPEVHSSSEVTSQSGPEGVGSV